MCQFNPTLPLLQHLTLLPPGAWAYRSAAATGRVGMSIRPDPERSGTVDIATRRCPRLLVVWDLHELTTNKNSDHGAFPPTSDQFRSTLPVVALVLVELCIRTASRAAIDRLPLCCASVLLILLSFSSLVPFHVITVGNFHTYFALRPCISYICSSPTYSI